MLRLDRLRASLLVAISGCGPAGLGSSAGETEADAESGPGESESDSETEAESETETGEECVDPCEAPVDIGDGLIRCADGSVNRAASVELVPTTLGNPCQGTEDDFNCMTDADCGEPYGSCQSYSGDGYSLCACSYSCANDADCGPGAACIPPGVVPGAERPICVLAPCVTNDDCGPCGECGLTSFSDGCGYDTRLSCRGPDDECRADDDCEPGLGCTVGPTHYICEGQSCFPGRPLLVDAIARTTLARCSADWATPTTLPRDPELAQHWARVAAIEHASIASFARFAQQLLALGAPPALLRETQAAARDEIHHAQLAYGLASAYAGTAIGPSRLALTGVAIAASWREIVAALIDEACVGETLGVAEAIAARDTAEHPVVRAALEVIAADEQRHAQLAWRCLAWLLKTANEDDRRFALRQLDATIAGLTVGVGGVDRPADGVLGGRRRAAVHRQAIAEVLVPVARQLAA